MTFDRDLASPRAALAALVAEHGVRRMVLAALGLLAPQPRPPDADALSPHLRRDVGLPPEPPRPEPPRFI